MKHILHSLLFIHLLIGLSACSGISDITSSPDNTSPNLGGTRFYSLSALSPTPTTANSKLRIGVGPVAIPRLLNRPQIVSRKNNTEVKMAEEHQWGGSYKEEVIQVLTDNLASLLKTENIEQYPWKFEFKPHYQVRIDIERLDGKLGKSVILKARWRLLKNNKEILVKRTRINTVIEGKSYNNYVKAQSKALAILSKKIATEINRLK